MNDYSLLHSQMNSLGLKDCSPVFIQLMTHINHLIIITNLNGEIVYCNENLLKLTNKTFDEILGKNSYKLFSPKEDWYKFEERIKNRLANQSEIYQSTFYISETEMRLVSVHANPLKNEHEEIIGTIGIMYDITDSQSIEKELIESRDKFQAVFDNSFDAVYLIDYATNMVFDCNYRTIEMFDLDKKEDFLGTNGLEFHKIKYTLQEVTLIRMHMEKYGEWMQELEFVTRKGTTFWGNVSSKILILNNHKITLIRVRDVSMRRRAEEQILKEQKHLLEAQELAHFGAWVYHFDTDTLELSPEMYRILNLRFGNNVKGIAGLMDFISPKDRDTFAQYIYKKDSEQERIEMAIGSSSKISTYLETRIRYNRGKDGVISSILGTSLDITEIRVAQQSLKESEERYKLMVQNAADVIYRCDPYGYFIYINPTAERISGYKSEEIIGHHFGELVREDYIPIMTDFYKEQFINRLPSTYLEFPMLCKDGSIIWLGQKVQQIVDKDIILGYQAVARDVTAKVEAEMGHRLAVANLKENETRLKAIFDNTQDAIWSIDLNGQLLTYNTHFLDIFKLSNPTTEIKIGDVIWNTGFILGNDWKTNYESVLKGNAFRNDLDIPFNDTLLHFENIFTPISDGGKIIGATIFARNITDRKKSEQELLKAKELAEQLVRAKEQFLSVMSHEIRTPMNAILGMSSLMLQETLNEEQQELLNGIKFSADNLLVIINDILDLSKIEAGQIRFESITCNLGVLLKEIVNSLKYRASEKGIQLLFEIEENVPNLIIADPVRLNQVLVNLVGNSIKFTHEGTINIKVSATLVENDLYEFLFIVSDTGIGIPADKLSLIFDRFVQADSDTTRKYGGTGLGLSITKRLVELQNGKIWVESELGIGSDFKFKLQFKKAINNDEYSKKLTNNELEMFEDLQLLVVEDNKMNQLVVTKVLKKWNIIADVVDNGFSAIDKTKAKKYDIILMDLQMPEIDGFETTKHIRSPLNKNKSTPIIALTASVSGDRKKSVLDGGMNDYISKPFDVAILHLKLKQFVPHKVKFNK